MRLRSRTPRSTPVAMGIPAYFYPYPGDLHWAALAEAPAGSFIVITPDNGPGAAPDPHYLSALEVIRSGQTVVYGYVDSAYAARDLATLLVETQTYQDWYAVGGIFVDQVTATVEHRDAYRELSDLLRARGLRVALNPGQPVIDPSYVELADHVVVFEGTQGDYLRCRFPRWMSDCPAERLWHLVYEVDDVQQYTRVATLAARRNAGAFFATDGRMPNPWDRLPAYWSHIAGSRATSPNG